VRRWPLPRAARRELFEETGFSPRQLQQVDCTYTFPMQEEWREIYPPGTSEVAEHVFLAVVESAGPTLSSSEHDAWRWCTFEEALALLAWPELPFYFHGGDLIMRVGWIPGAVGDIAAYVRESASPWASLHIRMWLPGMVWLMQRLIGHVARLSRSIQVSVGLENCQPLRFPGCEFEAQPQAVSEVIERTDCSLLLDLGHAQVSAAALGMDVHGYLSGLPLEGTVQVHLSGPRMRDGRACSMHTSPCRRRTMRCWSGC
jgi:ADP-ribose pyrophosphatase YjhB (NUDIX family)